MKLGTQTNSLVNHLYSRAVIGQPDPQVGMGATLLGWTDRYPGTVIEVFKIGKAVAIKVQADKYKRIDKNGMSESQEYEYTQDPNGSVYVFKQSSDEMWSQVHKNQETGRWNVSRRKGLRLGEREMYYDFSF